MLDKNMKNLLNVMGFINGNLCQIPVEGTLSPELFERRTIIAGSVRGFGSTTAVTALFNKEKDLYITVDNNRLELFKKEMRFTDGELDEYNVSSRLLTISEFNCTNINLPSKDLISSICDFMVDNKLEVIAPVVNTSESDSVFNINHIDVSAFKHMLSNHILNLVTRQYNAIPKKLTGYKLQKYSTVYIDVDNHYLLENATMIKNIMLVLNAKFHNEQLRFVIV